MRSVQSSDLSTITASSESSSSPRSPDAVDKRVGTSLRLQRTLANMSQEQLGDAVGVTFQQIQKYEKGTNRIGVGRLQRIADALGLSVSVFFEDPSEVTARGGSASEVHAFLSSPEGIDLVRAFLRVESPAMRRALVDVVRAASNLT